MGDDIDIVEHHIDIGLGQPADALIERTVLVLPEVQLLAVEVDLTLVRDTIDLFGFLRTMLRRDLTVDLEIFDARKRDHLRRAGCSAMEIL